MNTFKGWSFPLPRRLTLICLIILLLATVARAQDNAATSLPISYGATVSDTINNDAFFDHWQVNAQAGDRLYVRMGAANGLQPLIGILSAGGTLLARSSEGGANEAINLSFDVPEDGLYIVVATRAGNQFGTSTGSYSLLVDNLAATPTRDLMYQDVTFQCGESDAMAVATLHFAREDSDNGAYNIFVYGFYPFQPAIRVQSGDSEVCITEPASALGDVLTLPGERPITLTEADLARTAEYTLTAENTPDPSSITITIGSYMQMPGRYLVLVGGFALEPSDDVDVLDARLAPLPGNNGRAPMQLYVVGVNNRLDPSIITATGRCDDAGRRGCEDVPSFDGAGVILNNGVRIVGDRFDAGVRLADTLPHPLQIVSFSGTTRGEYALLLTGELPPTD
jgi:hypothetical protein